MGKNRMLHFPCLAVLAILAISCTTPPAPEVNAQNDRAKTIVQGTSTPDFPATTTQPPAGQTPSAAAQAIVTQQNQPFQPAATPTPGSGQTASAYGAALLPEEQAFLSNYLSRLSYMVYYNDASGVDPRFAKMAVSQANRYLIEKLGLSVIDFDQIERNKKDQMDAYQTETGGSIDMIQYLAQKFNADVYIEIDLKATGAGYPGSFSGSAQGTMKLFETSTAVLLGSIAFMTKAKVQEAVYDAALSAMMPDMYLVYMRGKSFTFNSGM